MHSVFTTLTRLSCCPLFAPAKEFAMFTTDRDALTALFHSTGGTFWNRNLKWNTDAELSQWYGVKVNDQERVVGLSLSDNNLQGSYYSLWCAFPVRPTGHLRST